MTTPAGWYPDPDGSGGQRYYDRQSWTGHRAGPAVEAPPLDAVQAAPRRTGAGGKVIAGIVAAGIVVVAMGVAAVWMTLRAGIDDTAVIRTPSDASAAAADPETGTEASVLDSHASSVGEPVRDGNFEFVVTGVERAPLVSDPAFPELQKSAAGEYVMVKVTVTNIGSEPQTFFASFNTLSDGTTEFRSDDEAWIYLGNTLADLSPGDSVDTAVVFDVPVGTDPESIELHEGPFTEGVVVGL